MASFDTGRLCAIVKILDKASSHLRLAARECARPGPATAAPAPAPDPAASAIVALLSVSEHASCSVRRALVHIRNGEAQRARDELDTARGPSGALAPAGIAAGGIAQPLPPRVTTALHLMLGITGFFPSETEQVLARAAVR
ncbi:hypothetical protein [Streptomyces flavofungini]|uniref:hypothetical protein n=1 Tax=Streptomyces flavofungini TaxID=68200 RepID=UPI0034DE22FF